MAITPSPQIPPRGARGLFSNAVDAFIVWLSGLPAQLDAFLAQLSTIAAGGANSFPYVFDSSTADTDPGAGRLRLSAFTQNTSTALRIDPVTGAGSNIAGLFSTLFAGTSGVKASLRLQKRNDPSKWIIFDMSTGSGTGYLNLSVAHRASSAPSPFTNNDDIMVYIDRVGDKGDVGNADKKVQTAPAAVANVVTVDYRNGNCLVWNPTAAATTALTITNWPADGTLGEFWIVGTNLGAATVNLSSAVDWLRPDGTYTNTASINANHGATLRTTGEDNVLLWGRNGAPAKGKVAR